MNDAPGQSTGLPGSAPQDARLETVSDTALMVAACRALETERPDALVRDPFARRLAGERGMAIARTSRTPQWMCFGVGVRARFMDELLTGRLAEGKIRTVVNLGAGLDTRPWRLALDSSLRWIEADFPQILEYKSVRMQDVPPHCRLEQVPTDLSDETARKRLFQSIGPSPALMITEGLLMYLPRKAVDELAADSHRLAGVRSWLLDAISPEMMRMAAGEQTPPVEKFRPEDHLAGQALLDVIAGAGWRLSARRTYARDGAAAAAARLATLAPKPQQAQAMQERVQNDPSGIYLFKRPG